MNFLKNYSCNCQIAYTCGKTFIRPPYLGVFSNVLSCEIDIEIENILLNENTTAIIFCALRDFNINNFNK